MGEGKVGVFWDYENCPPPSNASGYDVVQNIRALGHQHGDSIQFIKAYLEIPDSPRSITSRSELQTSGVSLIDCPHNNRKNVADNMIIVDMMSFMCDHPHPATIILISGDRDFAYALAVLRLRRYKVVVISPSIPRPHISLRSQASECFEWGELIAGHQIADEASVNSGQSLQTPPSSPIKPKPAFIERNSQSKIFNLTTSDSSNTPQHPFTSASVDNTTPPSITASSKNSSTPSLPSKENDIYINSNSVIDTPLAGKPLVPAYTEQKSVPCAGKDIDISLSQGPAPPVAIHRLMPLPLSPLPISHTISDDTNLNAIDDNIPIASPSESSKVSGTSTASTTGHPHTLTMPSISDEVFSSSFSSLVQSSSFSALDPPTILTQIRVNDTQPPVHDEPILSTYDPTIDTSTSTVTTGSTSLDTVESSLRVSSYPIKDAPEPSYSNILSKTCPAHSLANSFARLSSNSDFASANHFSCKSTPTASALTLIPEADNSHVQPTSLPSIVATVQVIPKTTVASKKEEKAVASSSQKSYVQKKPPPAFQILVEELQKQVNQGVQRPTRKCIAGCITSRDKKIYSKAGASNFRAYSGLAEREGIVVLGGNCTLNWIELKVEYYQLPSSPTKKISASSNHLHIGPFEKIVWALEWLQLASKPPLRSYVAYELAKFPNLYKEAGVSGFDEYVSLAEAMGIVQLEGQGQSATLSLMKDWRGRFYSS